jgi:hypothetical protein
MCIILQHVQRNNTLGRLLFGKPEMIHGKPQGHRARVARALLDAATGDRLE